MYIIALLSALTGLLVCDVLAKNSTASTSPCSQVGSLAANSSSVPASLALACLNTIPFNQTAATRFLQTLNSTFIPFQSTIAYLKNPPSSYQQPAADLIGRLQDIYNQVTTTARPYASQYDFEVDVEAMLQSTHDGHVSGRFGTVGLVFNFSNPLRVVSVSEDGQKLPQLYAFDDLNATLYDKELSWQPSSIQKINGFDAIEYTKIFAKTYAQANGLEPNVDWNTFMFNPASFVSQYIDGRSYGSRLYTESHLNVTFANGTQQSVPFQAYIRPEQVRLLAGITSGEDFYNQFVATSTSISPESQSGPACAASGSSAPAVSEGLTSWQLPAYPRPIVVQKGLGAGDPETAQEAYTTGYLIESMSLAVLSIPNFSMSGPAGQSFSDTVGTFVARVKAAGSTKLLIDLQGNPGGTYLDAFDVFKHLFPQAQPFSGSRLRSHAAANTLGGLYSGAWAEAVQAGNFCIQAGLSSNPWVAQVYDNVVTGQPFGSWEDLNRTYLDNGDHYMQTQLFNLSDWDQDRASAGYIPFGYTGGKNASGAQPWAAEDIVILTDGLCASACTVFMEFLVHQMGVRTVVAGGIPQLGPMQASGGVRGAINYLDTQIVTDISLARQQAPEAPLPSTDFGIKFNGSFNLRDQIRQNETFPLQFAYEAADCRIFFTPETFNNYTALWMYAANAIWTNSSLCVPGSTGHPSTWSNVTWNCDIAATECAGPSSSSNVTGCSGVGSPTSGSGIPGPSVASAASSEGGPSLLAVAVAAGFCSFAWEGNQITRASGAWVACCMTAMLLLLANLDL